MAQQWDVSGSWDIIQSNGSKVTLNVIQNGDQISASGTTGGMAGQGVGQVILFQFVFNMTWSNGVEGEYVGTFGINGRLEGLAIDLGNLNSHAYWFGTRLFTLV